MIRFVLLLWGSSAVIATGCLVATVVQSRRAETRAIRSWLDDFDHEYHELWEQHEAGEL